MVKGIFDGGINSDHSWIIGELIESFLLNISLEGSIMQGHRNLLSQLEKLVLFLLFLFFFEDLPLITFTLPLHDELCNGCTLTALLTWRATSCEIEPTSSGGVYIDDTDYISTMARNHKNYRLVNYGLPRSDSPKMASTSKTIGYNARLRPPT